MRDLISIPRVEALHPKYRMTFKGFVEESEHVMNTVFRVVQGWRTFAEQQAIYDQPHDHKDNDGDGRIDEADEKVTNAPAGKSFHNYGIAIDMVEMVAGKPNWNYKFSKLLPLADKYGLEWGGNFSNYDPDHFQIKGYSIENLYGKYLKKDFIPNTQYINL